MSPQPVPPVVSRPPTRDRRVAVVVATFNRCPELLTTLARLTALPERPQVVVVDNASSDGTADAVRARHPDVTVLQLPSGLGASGRNLGVRQAGAPYVAFADDDSWWAPGALATAADLFDRHPRLGLLGAKILVGADERVDPVCDEMAASPIPAQPDLPGPPILGFIACAAVVRREAFEEVGGFHRLSGFGGEEELLAVDLATAGWGLCYVDDVVAIHHPSPVRNARRRQAHETRNRLLRTWLRLPAGQAVRTTVSAVAEAAKAGCWRELGRLAVSLPPVVLRDRKVVEGAVARELAMLRQGTGDLSQRHGR